MQNGHKAIKIVEQKPVEYKSVESGILEGTLGHWVQGTPSASAKRSAEFSQQNKNPLIFIPHFYSTDTTDVTFLHLHLKVLIT